LRENAWAGTALFDFSRGSTAGATQLYSRHGDMGKKTNANLSSTACGNPHQPEQVTFVQIQDCGAASPNPVLPV
jgi:hypothetical protein